MSWFHWWFIPLIITIWTTVGFVLDQYRCYKEDVLAWFWNWLMLGPMIALLIITWGLFYIMSIAFA